MKFFGFSHLQYAFATICHLYWARLYCYVVVTSCEDNAKDFSIKAEIL